MVVSKTEGGYIMKLLKKLYKKRYLLHRGVIAAAGAWYMYVLTGSSFTAKDAAITIFFASYIIIYAFCNI